MSNNIFRGEVWLIDLNPVRGREQAGIRPCLIISVNMFHQNAVGLVVILPITSKNKNVPFHISLKPPEGGLKITSFIKCEDIRSISIDRLIKRLGEVSDLIIVEVEDRLRILMGL